MERRLNEGIGQPCLPHQFGGNSLPMLPQICPVQVCQIQMLFGRRRVLQWNQQSKNTSHSLALRPYGKQAVDQPQNVRLVASAANGPNAWPVEC